MTKKEEAAVLAHNDPKAINPTDILATFDAAVKRNDLRTVLATVELAPREAIPVLRKYFPSLDKTIISKCSSPDKYGCVLHPHGYIALRKLLDLPTDSDAQQADTDHKETPKRRNSKSGHKFTCRVAGRLPDDKFLLLQRYIRMEGYETTQDWVTAQVDRYIEKMEAKYGNA